MLKVPMKILHLRHLDAKNAKKREQNGWHYACVSVAAMWDAVIHLLACTQRNTFRKQTIP
jgi:hypothetical protein